MTPRHDAQRAPEVVLGQFGRRTRHTAWRNGWHLWSWQIHPFRLLVGTRFYDERERYGFRDLGTGGYTISAQAGTPAEDVDEYRWYSYWGIVFHSPRHRSLIEDLHGETSVPRSLLLESFMSEYERRVGRAYHQDMEPAQRRDLTGHMEKIHSSLRQQFRA